VKELTQSEIEKTEHLSRVCSQLVANETNSKLNFGATGEMKNVSSTTQSARISNKTKHIEKSKNRFESLKLTTLYVNILPLIYINKD